MGTSGMADLQILVTFSGRTCVVPIGKDHAQLRGNIAAEFDLLGIDVAGFARGGSVFPLSYVARAPREFFLSTRERALELIVLGPHHRAAPAFTQHKDRQNDAIIAFSLSSSGKPVTVTRKQWELLNFVRSKTGLGKTSLEDLRSAFDKYANKESLSKRGFDLLARDLIPSDSLSEGEKKILSNALSRIFFAFDRNGDGIAEGPDLFTALGTLVSSKGLAFAFRLADANGDGFVSPMEFLTFTRAFLTLVLALNDDVANFSANYVSSMIDSTADSVVRRAFHEADLNRDGMLTWSEFSSWYKNGGHMVMPWVSLLQSQAEYVKEVDGQAKLEAYSDDTNEIVYEFALAPTFGNLVVTRTDVDNLENLVRATKLFNKDATEVMELFCSKASKDEMLTKEAFDECLRALAPEVASMRREDRNRISYVLNNVFFAFDRVGNRRVKLDEFCTGFALLCAGSKSTKLQLAFSLFDVDGEGFIRAIDFARFLRSVLTILFALNDAAASLTSFQVYEAIDKTTARATKVMLKNIAEAANTDAKPELVSFEDFANFYNTQSGNEMISFVELLDLSKFPFSDFQPHKQNSASKKEEADDEVVFSFDLLPVPEKLDVMMSDAKRLRRVLLASSMINVTPNVLHSVVADFSKQRMLTKANYELLLSELQADFAEDDLDGYEDDPQLVSYFFNSLFYSYDREGIKEEVSSSEIACGMSVLCGGKKSDKLAYGFSAFDADQDGGLTATELSRFLRSFITALFVLVQKENLERQDPEHIWQVVDTTSADLTADIIHSLGGVNRVSFEDFAQWYGKGGYKTASFLELLDMSKWPDAFDDDDDDVDEDDEDKEGEAEDTDIPSRSMKGNEIDKLAPVFVFALTRKHTLEVEQTDIEFVREVVEASGFNQVGCDELINALATRADEQSTISEEDFLQSMSFLINSRGVNREFAKEALLSLYEVCDREGLYCDYRDFLGLLFLCGGSKSTKLAHGWNTVSSSRDGDLDRTQLFSLLRAFLAALHTFNYGANSVPMDELHHNIDDAANVLAANIFLASRRKKKDTISFEEFAEFYSEGGGYRLAPWLELLNLGKFIGHEFEYSPRSQPSHPEHRHTQQHVEQTNGVQKSSNGARVIFTFKITDEGDSLVVNVRDVLHLRAVLDQSNIGSIDPEQMVRMINEQVDEYGRLTEQGFGTFVGSHVLKNLNSNEDEFVAAALYQLFSSFDLEGDGTVDPTPFAVSLSLLGSGSKSSKLSLGWALFSRQEDDDSDLGVGPMSEPMLTEFFVTLLTAISCFAGNCLDDDVIRVAGSQAAQRVFEDIKGNEISFDGFASWYTGQGFEHLSWIELLANSKWRLPEKN